MATTGGTHVDDNSRIARLEEVAKTHGDRLKEHEVKIAANQEKIDKLNDSVQKIEAGLEIIKIYSKKTDETVTEIKDDFRRSFEKIDDKYTELRKIRDEDHLIKPMDKLDGRQEKVWWGVVGGVIGIIVPLIFWGIINAIQMGAK